MPKGRDGKAQDPCGWDEFRASAVEGLFGKLREEMVLKACGLADAPSQCSGEAWPSNGGEVEADAAGAGGRVRVMNRMKCSLDN